MREKILLVDDEKGIVDVMEAAALSVAGCLLATAVPLRGIAKMEIVPSIEAVE